MLDNIVRYLFVAAFTVAALVSCSGTQDDMVVPEGVLRIFVEGETTVSANGEDKVIFRVMYGSQDVSTSTEMNIIRNFNGDESSLSYGVNEFSTTAPGTYVFTARYFDGKAVYTDNEVTVTALPAGDIQTSEWVRKVLGIQFTSTTCIGCPDLTSALKSIMAERPGVLCPVAFHCDYEGPDPMKIDASRQFVSEFLGTSVILPALFFNMHQPTTQMTNVKAVIDAELALELKSVSTCGVSLSSSFDAVSRKVSLTVSAKSNVDQVCRLVVFLVEDGIVATQLDDPYYVHNNVVRAVLSSSISSIYGDYLNNRLPLYPGTEYGKTYEYVLPDEWNAANMRVVASVLVPDAEDRSFLADNTNECALSGGKADYMTNEN